MIVVLLTVLLVILIGGIVVFWLTGAFLATLFWLFVKLPLGLLLIALGLGLCCTLILCPIGWRLLKRGFRMVVPGL